MPRVTVTVEIEVDGVPIAEYPIIVEHNVTALDQPDFPKQVDVAPAFESLIELQRANVANIVYVSPDAPVMLRLAGQSDRGVFLQPGGFILLFGAVLTAPSHLPAVATQNSGAPFQIHALLGGDV